MKKLLLAALVVAMIAPARAQQIVVTNPIMRLDGMTHLVVTHPIGIVDANGYIVAQNDPAPITTLPVPPAPAAPQYDSWTYNVDFKDPDALSAFIGRALHNGQWVGGARYDPASLYHVTEATGEATRWARAGVMVVTNAERLNATFGPHIGLDVAQWTSRAEIAGPISSAAKLWKPLGFASLTATVDVWGGWMPVHTADVNGNIEGGFGFSLQGRFGGPSQAAGAANAIIRSGL